jgi:hypothetical protein
MATMSDRCNSLCRMVISRARWRVFKRAVGAAVKEYRTSRKTQLALPVPDRPEPHDDFADVVEAIHRFGGEHYDLPLVGPSSEALAGWDAVGWLDAYSPFDRIMFTADGEDLAEELVEAWLACMAPALEHYGLALTVETVDSSCLSERLADEGDYIVMINGVRCQIWAGTEWDYDAEPPWDPWLVATLRPLAVINTLLAACGSKVRAHTMNAGGNDAVVVLIDPIVVSAMRHSGDYPESAIPVLVAGTQ